MLVGFRALTIATDHLQRRRCSCYRLLRAAIITTATVVATIVGWRISNHWRWWWWWRTSSNHWRRWWWWWWWWVIGTRLIVSLGLTLQCRHNLRSVDYPFRLHNLLALIIKRVNQFSRMDMDDGRVAGYPPPISGV